MSKKDNNMSMSISLPLAPKKGPPLELVAVNLYSNGIKKVFTNKFYLDLNKSIGCLVTIKNNTNITQTVSIGCCVYTDSGKELYKFPRKSIDLSRNTKLTKDFQINDALFSALRVGNYKIQIWINDKKVIKRHFYVLKH